MSDTGWHYEDFQISNLNHDRWFTTELNALVLFSHQILIIIVKLNGELFFSTDKACVVVFF